MKQAPGRREGGGLPFPLSDPFIDDRSSRDDCGGSDNFTTTPRMSSKTDLN